MAPANNTFWFNRCKLETQSGFTLIEIMIVTVIISILIGISIPRILQELPDYRLKSASRALYSALQRAKLLATKENTRIAISFDTVAGNYQILRDPGPDGDWGTGDDTSDRPGPDLVYGNADDVPEDAPVLLTTYGNSIVYGTGAATTNATQSGGAFPGDNVSYLDNIVAFNSRGFLATLPPGNLVHTGYVYLTNRNNTCFAVSTPTVTGNIVLRRWSPGGSDWFPKP